MAGCGTRARDRPLETLSARSALLMIKDLWYKNAIEPTWNGAKWEMWVTGEPGGQGKTLLTLGFAATDKS